MIFLAIILAALFGFGCLALAMAKHHRDLFGRTPPKRVERGMRVLGWSGLTLSLALSILAEGVSAGIVQWLGCCTLSGFGVTLILTYRESWWRA